MNTMSLKFAAALAAVICLGGACSGAAAATPDVSTPNTVTALTPSNSQIYGVIQPNGTVTTGSRGILSVIHLATGAYCILPKSLTLQTSVANGILIPQATLIETTGAGIINIYRYSTFCPSTSYIQVLTTLAGSMASYDQGFVISFN